MRSVPRRALPPGGFHVSSAGGLSRAVDRALERECTCLQIFCDNPRAWATHPRAGEELEEFRRRRQAAGLTPLAVHACYLINPCAPDRAVFRRSVQRLAFELALAADLGAEFYVLHPGSSRGRSPAWGVRRARDAIARAFTAAGRGPRLLLENTAGQGANLGYRFEHLGAIIERMDEGKRMGICFDTCHALAAGYDLRTVDGFHQVMEELDRTVGLDRLGAFHVNDSKKGLGSRVDRHDHIGEGEVGLEGFRGLMNDARFTEVPMVLETPKDKEMTQDVENLKKLRSLVAG